MKIIIINDSLTPLIFNLIFLDNLNNLKTNSDYFTCSTMNESKQSKGNKRERSFEEQDKENSSILNSFLSNVTNHSIGEIERLQVNTIKEAYSHAIKLVRKQDLSTDLSNSIDINTTINVTELSVKRVIFFFKLISDFRNLPENLMIKLLKQNMTSLLQLHGINSFNRQENTFKQPETDDLPFTADSLKYTYSEEIYQIIMSITNNLYDLCNQNMTFIKITMLVVLFDPQIETLDENEKILIEELQIKYVNLLYSYMCDSFGATRAETAFKSLILELNRINDLSKIFERVVVEKSNFSEISPLMKEIFLFINLQLCHNLKKSII